MIFLIQPPLIQDIIALMIHYISQILHYLHCRWWYYILHIDSLAHIIDSHYRDTISDSHWYLYDSHLDIDIIWLMRHYTLITIDIDIDWYAWWLLPLMLIIDDITATLRHSHTEIRISHFRHSHTITLGSLMPQQIK